MDIDTETVKGITNLMDHLTLADLVQHCVGKQIVIEIKDNKMVAVRKLKESENAINAAEMHNDMRIVAKKWWHERCHSYPFVVTTIKHKSMNPQSLNEQFKKRLPWITVGLMNAGRIWAFETKEDGSRFLSAIPAALIERVSWPLS